MHPAALPAGALKHRADSLLQPGGGVGDDELDAVDTAGLQRAEEARPKGLGLAVTDVETKDLAAPVGGNTDRDDHGLGDDAVVDPRLAIRGVEEHVGVPGLAEVPVTERGDFTIQIRANTGHFGLGDAGVGAEGLDQVVDLPGRDAVEVSLHYDGEQGLVHAAAPLEQGGEERPLAQLGDLQIQVPGGRRQDARSGAVALSGAVLGAFETAGADEGCGLCVDEFLVERFCRDADAIGDMGELEFREEVKQGRLV